MPKVKTFLWRTIHKALPTMAQLSRRIRRIPPKCIRCGLEDENEHHMLFMCPASRAAWFASPLAIRSEELPINMLDLMESMMSNLPDQHLSLFLNLMWTIWKSRNEMVFRGKKEMPQAIVAEARVLTHTEMMTETTTSQAEPQLHPPFPQNTQCICYCDGSWDTQGRAGIGVVFSSRGGIIQHVYCNRVQASSPFHAEVLALKEAMFLAASMGYPHHTVYCTDAHSLVVFCNTGDEAFIGDWQATTDAYCVRSQLSSTWRESKVIYVPRKFLQYPHILANHARTEGVHLRGIPSYHMMEQMRLSQSQHLF